MPTSTSASSPARLICSSTSARARPWASSIRAGWIRPSDTSFSRVSRATSRRTGSKHDSTTASGVSSMIRLTPVSASKARMLRPSRPMIRPFMSSEGRGNTDTLDSLVCSVATRWMAMVTILRARFSPSSRALCSISRTVAMASRFASSTTWATSASLASWAVRRPIRSSSLRCSCPIRSTSARSRCTSLSPRWMSCSLRVSSASFASSPFSWRASRSSCFLISSRRRRTFSSASLRMAEISCFTSRRACRTFPSASRSASATSLAARASASWSRLDTRTFLRARAIAAPAATATTATTAVIIVSSSKQESRTGGRLGHCSATGDGQ